MLPLPSRTHPKNQTPVVYTEELTHLAAEGRGVARLESLRCLQLGGKVSGPEVISANMGSFDCVRLAPHFAQDDSGSYNGGSYDRVSYNCSLITALLTALLTVLL